jgi:hypothetical protein
VSTPHSCAWCGDELPREHEHGDRTFCPDCQRMYEAESRRSLHPVEERHPHND